MTSTIW